jgi:hypothetical protein
MSKVTMTLEQVECFRADWAFPTEDAESARVNALCDQALLAIELEERIAELEKKWQALVTQIERDTLMWNIVVKLREDRIAKLKKELKNFKERWVVACGQLGKEQARIAAAQPSEDAIKYAEGHMQYPVAYESQRDKCPGCIMSREILRIHKTLEGK